MSATVEFSLGVVPEDFCHETWQQTFQELVDLLTGTLPGNYTTWNYGDDAPAPEDRNKPWLRTISGNPDRVYVYNGAWLCLYDVPESGQERRMWVGNPTDLKTYDGGEDTAITPATGPFWEVDTDFAAHFPVGPGTFTSGATVAVGGTGGEEKHLLTGPESGVAAHSHQTTLFRENSDTGGPPAALVDTDQGLGSVAMTSSVAGPTNAAEAHNNLPPYRGIYFIKRTARKYRRVGAPPP